MATGIAVDVTIKPMDPARTQFVVLAGSVAGRAPTSAAEKSEGKKPKV